MVKKKKDHVKIRWVCLLKCTIKNNGARCYGKDLSGGGGPFVYLLWFVSTLPQTLITEIEYFLKSGPVFISNASPVIATYQMCFHEGAQSYSRPCMFLSSLDLQNGAHSMCAPFIIG